MRKRGQDTGVFNYMFIAIIAMLILFAGHKAISSISDAACRSGSVSFGIDVESIGEGLPYGKINLKELIVPCKAEKVYFIDTTKQADSSLLKSAPLIRDSIEDDTGENVFLTNKADLEGTFTTGTIEIGYPHYLCMKPRNGRVSLFVKSLGNRSLLTQGCNVADCTEIPVSPSNIDARNIIDDFVGFGYSGECEDCPADTGTEYRNYIDSKDDVEIFRRFTYCAESGFTKVEIIIRSDRKLENFYLYEQIPKECVSSLKTYLESVEGDVTIKDDPLMMWHFDKIKEEEKVSYTLKKELSENCKKLIEGLGIERIQEGERQARTCQGTDTSCGTYPDCENCNEKDGYTGNSYCSSDNVIRNYNDYSCKSNRCTSSTTSKTIKSCTSGQTCQNGNCADTTQPAITEETAPPDEPITLEPDEPITPEPDALIPEPVEPAAPTCSDECSTPGQKQCSGDFSQTCADFNDDGCLEWNTGTNCQYGCSNGGCDSCTPASWAPAPNTICSGESFTQTSDCQTTRQSTGTKSCSASLSLSFSGVSYQYSGGQHYYYHTRTFSESNGVGVTLTSAKMCFQSTGGCNSATVNYRVEGNDQLVLSNKNFNTPSSSDIFTLSYSGTDDNGNPITVSQSMSVSGSSHSP